MSKDNLLNQPLKDIIEQERVRIFSNPYTHLPQAKEQFKEARFNLFIDYVDELAKFMKDEIEKIKKKNKEK